MQMQSKKLSQPPYSPLIITVFILSLIYWLYLGLTTQMNIVFDSLGYESLGRLILNQGWLAYFQTGPNREPIYPLLVAGAMGIQNLTGMTFVKIMAFLGAILMLLTQVLTYQLLRLLNIRNGICAFVLIYFALSPALNNAAFSLYSEIAAFPIILGIVLASVLAWDSIQHNKWFRALVFGTLLGILLSAVTFVKAVFECITPVYLVFFFAAVLKSCNNDFKKIIPFMFCLLTAIGCFYGPITAYKWLNFKYNGNFVITNRGSWALYGNTARRMEPLTVKRLLEALAFVPGEGVCNGLFGPKECDFWSYRKSDELGFAKQDELANHHLSSEQLNAALLKASASKALHNPFQYALLTLTEGLKMFFWESTKIGFVGYPHWLQRIYDIKLFNNALRFWLALISGIAVFSLWRQMLSATCPPLVFVMGLLIFLYIFFFSFFFILTRYALPLAPLYLAGIALGINQIFASKK